MKKTKRQRKALNEARQKTTPRLHVTPRKWSKKTKRIFDKQFERFVHEELYVPWSKKRINCQIRSDMVKERRANSYLV